MAKYKLKEEAKQFFDSPTFNNYIADIPSWKYHGIPEELLDKVEKVKIIQGYESKGGFHMTGWNSSINESEIYLTIKASDIRLDHIKDIKVDKLIKELEIVANKFFED